ncbi:MAG: Gfo/Idh/MocA family oxidoreductase [Lachnospiraceae bacterium]|nr:Gfo/Idh/MocA family oxidoreductase [Lachnospiraceae bacterium]
MKLGIIGTGKIVHEALFAMEEITEIERTAIFARPKSREKGEKLAEQYGIGKVYTDYAELLSDSGVDCVYIGLVNSAHYPYAKQALLAGVNVILEKPFVSTMAEAGELASIAAEKGVFCLEAITTLHSKVFEKMAEIMPKLGPLKMAQCNFSQYSSRYKKYLAGEVEPAFDPDLSGGALYDINLYNVYLTIGLLGAPKDAKYFPNLGFNGIDTSGTAVLCYDGVTGVCTGAKDSDSPSFAIFQGENGWMRLIGKPNTMEGVEYEFADDTKPPVPNAAGGMSRAMESGKFTAPEMRHRMTQEFRDFARIVDTGDDAAAAAFLEKSVAVMTALETARKSAGIRFAVDE